MTHYLYSDTHRLISPIPFMLLAKPKSALAFLERVVEAGDEWGHVLGAYPNVRCEPLDFHYVCQQSLSAFEHELMADLVQYFGWQGAVWGSLLAALSRDSRYMSHLEAARRTAPGNLWAMEVALSALDCTVPSNYPAHTELLERLRAQLAPLPRLRVHLRVGRPREEIAAQADAVRAAYRSGDFQAALAHARQ